MTTTHTRPFAALNGEQFLVITTFRRSGEGVPTTVWFAEPDGRLYITTGRAAGKAKRVAHTPQVTLTPSDARGATHGPALPARARIAEGAERDTAEQALAAKYGQRFAEMRASRPSSESVYLVVEPAA